MMRTVLSLFFFLGLSACTSDLPTGGECHDDHVFDTAPGPADPTVVFSPDGQPEARVRVDILRITVRLDNLTWANICMLDGVMSLPEDDGALTVFPFNFEWPFDTLEVLVPTDLIYILSSQSVLDVVPNMAPQSGIVVSPEDQSRYAVQVNAGWAARHGVGPGTPVRFENFLP